jgi:hypothetical protein
MDSDTLKFIANFTATKLAGWIAGGLLTLGWLQPNQETQFETIGAGIVLGALGYTWSWWNTRGKQAVLAELAKAHGVAPQSASTATASNALVASVNDNKVLPLAGGAVKIASALLMGFILFQAIPAMAQTKTVAKAAVASTTKLTTVASTAKLTTAQAMANQVALIQAFTVSDLQAALADAQVQSPPDTVSASCYSALIPIVQSTVANPLPASLGGFQALQKARDFQNLVASLQSQNGPLAPLVTACAPLILSVQNVILGLGLKAGLVSGTMLSGGLALPIALPAIGAIP